MGDNAVIKAGVWGSGGGAVSAGWGGELTIGKNAFIINDGTNHAHKDDHNAVEASRDAKLEIGEGSQIYTAGEGTSHGIITENGAEVIIGKNSIISTAGNESLGIAPGGDNSYGLYVTDDSSIKIGEGSLIKTGGEGSYAVVAVTGSQITLEDKVQIESTAVGIYSMSDGTVVTGGNDMRITETSEEGIAVYATEEGEVILGDRAVIKAENTSGRGVYASGAGSKITMGKDAYIQVGAGESRGVYASKGGEISLAGATIRAAGSEDSFAILASGVDSSAISKIHGDGKFAIEGDISAGDYSEIHLDMTEESYFKGMTEKTEESNLEISLDKSRWDLTKSSELDRLMVSGGVVDLSQAGLGTTLEVDHLEAGASGGTFVFQTDIAGTGNGVNNRGDKLIVRESSQGDHQVHVINNGAADTNGSETLTIIETADGMTSGVDFQLTNEVEAGGYTYGMRAIDGSGSDKNWELYSTGEISHPADAAVNLFSGSYLLNYAEMNTLMQRMGDLRNGEDKGNIWARTFGGKMKTKGGSLLRGYDMDYWGLQVGADKKIDLKKGALYVGGMFGYSKGDIGYRSGSGSIDSKSIGVYGTYIASNDFYADLVLKYGWMKDDFKVYDTAGNLVKGEDIDTNGLTASLEIGKRYHFDKTKEGWYIEPQGQISISQAHVELGSELEITTSGDDGIGIYNYNGSIITDEGVKITTSGTSAHGIQTVYSWETNLGEGLEIHVSGSNAHGILAEGSKVSVGDGAVISAMGDDGVAVFTNGDPAYESSWPTSVEFLGGATIKADSAKNGYALYSRAGQITSKLDDYGNVINDQDGGNFQIVGDMQTEADGKIDMYMGTGSLFIGSADQGDGYIHLHMQEGSTWYVTKDKNANVCLDQGAHLYLGHPDNWSGFTKAAFVPVTIKNAEVMTANGGTINFRTDIASQQADYLILEKGIVGPGGYVSVANQGSAATTGSEIVPLMDDVIPAATPAQFALTNTVELGGYNYVLNQRDDGNGGIEWYLEAVKSLLPDNPKPPVITDPGSAGVNIFSGAYLLNYAETQTLLKRLGDLRGGTQDNGVWARVYGGKFQSSGDSFLRGFDMDYWGMQTGYDKKIEREDKRGTVYVGGFFGYSKGDLDYLNNGSGSIDSKSIGAYWTHIHRNDFYADAVLKYNWMKNDFKQLDSAGSWVKGSDINTQGFTGSLEVGRRYFLKTKENGEKIRVEDRQGWYVEPQFQLTLGHQGGGNFTASNGLRIKADAHRSVMARVETHLGYEVKSGKNPVNVYAKLGVVKEFDGEVDYTLNGSRESTSYGDTWKLWGLGVTAKFGKKHDVYFEVERATGGQFTQSWAINGGYRFSW